MGYRTVHRLPPRKEKGTAQSTPHQNDQNQTVELARSETDFRKAKLCQLRDPHGENTYQAPSKSSPALTRFSAKEKISYSNTSSPGMQMVGEKFDSESSIISTEPNCLHINGCNGHEMGAQVDHKLIKRSWSAHQKPWHINKKELFAIYATIRLHRSHLKNKCVLVQADNQTVLAYIRNQGGTKYLPLLMLTSRLLKLTHKWRIDLTTQYIPGSYNTIVDALSRNSPLPGWHLSKEATRIIFQKWGTPAIDLFATNKSKVVPAYATSKSWDFHLAWIFPPPCLIPQVLQHLNQAKGTYILIAPGWEKVFWKPDIRSRALAAPFQIPNLDQHLVDASTSRPLGGANHLRLDSGGVKGGRWGRSAPGAKHQGVTTR